MENPGELLIKGTDLFVLGLAGFVVEVGSLLVIHLVAGFCSETIASNIKVLSWERGTMKSYLSAQCSWVSWDEDIWSPLLLLLLNLVKVLSGHTQTT